MKIKHSKYKNSGILFELLVRQITSDTLEGKDSPIKEILKKYFVKTELGKEYKLYETLLAKEELMFAEDLGNFFRVSADNRDLNYKKYFTEGKGSIANIEDYNSHNTTKLTQEELLALLIKIGYTGKKSNFDI